MEFDHGFRCLTEHAPFPWQRALYEELIAGRFPTQCSLPTGVGKTSVIAVWLLALANKPAMIPRRLVYVVNRRTVVDQTTHEVKKYLANLEAAGLRSKLEKLCAFRLRDDEFPLAVSTLRGQFADNQEWSADPARPAVICGTVDMIGSRLLFSGYRIGFKSRPLHAGFLGQDALLVHDEAHLEPAFQQLIESIEKEQEKGRKRGANCAWLGIRVMALSATARGGSGDATEKECKPFELTDEEKQPPEDPPDPPTEPVHHVWRRLKAKKSLRLHSCDDKNKLAEQIADLAVEHQGEEAAVLIFVRKVDDIAKVVNGLKKKGVPENNVETLTGTMRGYERDRMVDPHRSDASRVFARFLPPPQPDAPQSEWWQIEPLPGTVYLVCTSAGEVGVNLSADHLVCDLSTFDSMAQRLGRVNRFGDRDDTQVDVVHPAPGEFDEKDKLTPAREATLALLQQLNGDGSPKAFGDLPAERRLAAFAPEPIILPATDILFDVWALTTIKGRMPGRPTVAPYLHGIAEWEPPRTSVAWRDEVEHVTVELIEREGEDFPQELLADYPLKPHELLSDRTVRVYATLEALVAGPKPNAKMKPDVRRQKAERARKNAAANIWLVDGSNSVAVTTLGRLMSGEKKRVLDRLADAIVLLPPSVGGLSAGMFSGESQQADDVADRWLDEDGEPRRGRVWDEAPPPTYADNGETKPMALIRTIDTDPLAEEYAPEEETEAQTRKRFWHWYARPRDAGDATLASPRPITWDHHTGDVVRRTTEIVERLNLPDDLKRAVILAAELHDLGKKREIWQRSIGNPNPTDWHAKPGKPNGKPRWRPRRLSDYRHEFGSLLDAEAENTEKLKALSDEMQDVVLHLVAAHHGYARPHFPPDAYDHECYATEENEQAAHEVMRRYARLQRRYGRWGLAYLESLLRAADWAASANPSESEGDA